MNISSFRKQTIHISPEVRGLLDNGIDFLNKAQEEFENSPTHSIVSLWTAIELLLKVPLAHEHWSLVCSGKKIVRKNYLSGDFISVTFDETCARLGDILERPLSRDTLDTFNKIRKHRNRVVHFFHDAFTDEDKARLLAEQADAWFALNRLLREDWKTLFEGALGNYLAGQETALLIKNSYYADIKYRHVKQAIEKHVFEGGHVEHCGMCKKDSALLSVLREANGVKVWQSTCMVCSFIPTKAAEVKCPGCGKTHLISDWPAPDFVCLECAHEISRYTLLDTSSSSGDEFAGVNTPAGCGFCNTRDTVCDFGESYICSACLTIHETIDPCAFCGYHSTDVSEYSKSIGCPFCDGEPVYVSDE